MPASALHRWGCLAAATLVYLGCTLAFFYNDLPNLTTHLLGPPEDNMQELWDTWYAQQPGRLTPGDSFFTRLLFYPDGVSLRFHSFSYSNLVLIRVLRNLFSLPSSLPVLIGMHNAMLLASFVLGGAAAYCLAYYVTGRAWAAWVAGYIFAFSPFHFAHSLHHLHIATIQYLPVFVLFVLRLEATHKIRHGVGATVCFVLGALSSWYYLVYNAFFLVFLYLYRAMQARRVFVFPLLYQCAGVLASALLLLSPVVGAMIVEGSGNPRAYAGGHDWFVADLTGLFVFHPYHLAARVAEPINRRLAGNAWEASVYLGLVNLGLLGWALCRASYRRDPVLRWALWGMVFFLAFAGGETLHILGKPVPYALLPTAFVKHLPVLTNLRTVSRAISYTYLFLGIAVARILGLRQASIDGRARMERPATRWPALITLLLVLGLVLDFWTLNRESTPVTCPAAYAVMDGDASEFGILDLPLTYQGGESYMTYQICHHRPIMHAIIGRKLTLTLSDYLADLSPAEVRGALRAARVKYVVIHTQLPSDPPVDVAWYERTYPVVYRDPTAIVLQVY